MLFRQELFQQAHRVIIKLKHLQVPDLLRSINQPTLKYYWLLAVAVVLQSVVAVAPVDLYIKADIKLMQEHIL